jgi:Tfp pilus assembly protein PilO
VKIKNRQQLLTIGAIVVVALFAADKLVLSPLGKVWTARSTQIADLRKKVQDGAQLVGREQHLRSRWDQMRNNTLPNNPSLAEQQVVGAFDRWSRDSRISITSISPQSKHDAEEYMTLQCRVEAAGTLNTLGQFLYAIEKDPMALKLEIVELSARDNTGQQLALGLQVSGLVLTPHEKRP